MFKEIQTALRLGLVGVCGFAGLLWAVLPEGAVKDGTEVVVEACEAGGFETGRAGELEVAKALRGGTEKRTGEVAKLEGRGGEENPGPIPPVPPIITDIPPEQPDCGRLGCTEPNPGPIPPSPPGPLPTGEPELPEGDGADGMTKTGTEGGGEENPGPIPPTVPGPITDVPPETGCGREKCDEPNPGPVPPGPIPPGEPELPGGE